MKVNETSRRVGLARALSKLGYCSRSQAAQMILAGRIRLNGPICRDPESPVRIERDKIAVDELPISEAVRVYWKMNKPRGVVTTAADEKQRATVYEVLRSCLRKQLKDGAQDYIEKAFCQWVAPVGRLDKASEGLLLLTNDSEWASRVAAPETHLEKTYHVQIDTVADEELMRGMVRGIDCGENKLRARCVQLLRTGTKNCWLEVVLDEGRNRHIRRMMSAVGAEVLRLVRVAIGPVQLGELAKGECRVLTSEEKKSIDLAVKNVRRK